MRLPLTIAALLVFAAQCSAAPNLIVMMTDDQRADFMSCAGHPFLKTPNMDRIAKEGVRFPNAFVTNALCAPSRPWSMRTGRTVRPRAIRAAVYPLRQTTPAA